MRRGFLEGVFPRGCLLCGLPLTAQEAPWGVCEACDAGLPRIEGPQCEICGKPLVSELRSCLRCRNSQFHFDTNHSALLYAEGGRSLIQAYKFSQERHLAPIIHRLMLEKFLSLGKRPDIIVAVPPSVSKLRKRGWDPVRLMALAVARQGIPFLDLLAKRRGREQKSLDFEGRMANIKGRFTLRGKLPRASDFLLIDDVFTTGATLSECSRILKENGAERVSSLTLALDP